MEFCESCESFNIYSQWRICIKFARNRNIKFYGIKYAKCLKEKFVRGLILITDLYYFKYLGTFSVKYLLRGKERLQICDEEKNAGVV